MNYPMSRTLCLAAALTLTTGLALAADPYVNVTVGGLLTPGVYGRVDVGNAPPPPVLYAQPVYFVKVDAKASKFKHKHKHHKHDD